MFRLDTGLLVRYIFRLYTGFGRVALKTKAQTLQSVWNESDVRGWRSRMKQCKDERISRVKQCWEERIRRG